MAQQLVTTITTKDLQMLVNKKAEKFKKKRLQFQNTVTVKLKLEQKFHYHLFTTVCGFTRAY
jgi:hypothetical protein